MATTPNLGITYFGENQASAHVVANAFEDRVDALLHLAAKDRDLKKAPSSPANGDRYILPARHTYPIAGVNQGTKEFTIVGDLTSMLAVDDRFLVSGSTGNDKNYTLAAISFSFPDTTIQVSETIPDATVDGNIEFYETGGWNWDASNSQIPTEHQVPIYYDGWVFKTPKEGWQAWLNDENLELLFDGTLWVPTPYKVQAFGISNFNLNTTSSQNLFTLPSGYGFSFLDCILHSPTTSAATGVFNLGSSGTSQNSLLNASKNLTNLVATDDQVVVSASNRGNNTPAAQKVLKTAGDVIQGKMTTAIGSAGTCHCYVLGYVFPL